MTSTARPSPSMTRLWPGAAVADLAVAPRHSRKMVVADQQDVAVTYDRSQLVPDPTTDMEATGDRQPVRIPERVRVRGRHGTQHLDVLPLFHRRGQHQAGVEKR